MVDSIFDIYGFTVLVNSNNEEISKKLNRDFSFFKSTNTTKTDLTLTLNQEDIPGNIVPIGLKASRQSINSITYDQGQLRYNDYYSKALSVFNYEKEECTIYSNIPAKLHEIAYLLILSRSAKANDLLGIHKIHAFSVSNSKNILTCMLPMKGGKTTHFINLIKDDPSINIISDDSPIVDKHGNIKPFPLRVGIDNPKLISELKSIIDEKYFYEIHREQYGVKTLIETLGFKNGIDKDPTNKNSILIQGIRISGDKCHYQEINKLQMFKYLFTHMTIGVGLPLIIEYFLESSFKDHFRKAIILSKRIFASIKLLQKSKCYLIYMGHNIEKNVFELKKILS